MSSVRMPLSHVLEKPRPVTYRRARVTGPPSVNSARTGLRDPAALTHSAPRQDAAPPYSAVENVEAAGGAGALQAGAVGVCVGSSVAASCHGP